MNTQKTTNLLLAIIAIPVFFYILKLLGFIFIPLVASMFISVLFLPLMRWLKKRKVPKFLRLSFVLIIMLLFFKIFGEVVKLSSNEILNTSSKTLLHKAEIKLDGLIQPIERFFGIPQISNKNSIKKYLHAFDFSNGIGASFKTISNTVSMLFIMFFFVFLWLAESFNFQKFINETVIGQKFASIKVFMQIEKDLLTFIKVKFLISLFTGIGFTIACYLFDVSFPIFWGLFAFVINFIQMVGSIISIIIASLFAFVELDNTGTLLLFILVITAIQALMGGILEPIFMGKSFSINVITIIVMLMFWGYIWGIPGLIMSIPITVFIKIMLEQFPKTKVISDLVFKSK